MTVDTRRIRPGSHRLRAVICTDGPGAVVVTLWYSVPPEPPVEGVPGLTSTVWVAPGGYGSGVPDRPVLVPDSV
jgi:hypothetical protein